MRNSSPRVRPEQERSTITRKPRHHLSLRDRAYDAIKDRIITCGFQPGESIDEVSVANLLGFGRTPIHQALGRLHFEGLVDVIPRKGVVVSPVVMQDVMQLVEARFLNETQCVRLAAERSDFYDLEAIISTLGKAKGAIADRDVKAMMHHDREFHFAVAKASKNEVLTHIVSNLNERCLRFWFISFTSDHHPKFLKQHETIVDALKSRNADAAEQAMRSHLETFRQSVMRRL